MQTRYFSLLFLLYIFTIVVLAYFIPIAPHEAKIFYESNDIVSDLMNIGNNYIGGIFGIRVPFIIVAVFTVLLFWIVSKDYLKNHYDANLTTAIFMFLPALLVGGMVANISILLLSVLLIFLVAHHRKIYILEIFSMATIWWLSDTSVILFFILILYAFRVKKWYLVISSVIFIALLYMQHRGIEIGGKPIGHLAETFSVYATVLSPFIFLYIIFAIYPLWIKEPNNILGYISFFALLISMLLSIRQRIVLVDFAPYIIIGLLPAVARYLSSLRVRLPQFQQKYKNGFTVSLSLLSIGFALLVSIPILFYFTNKSPYAFTNKIYKPYIAVQSANNNNTKCYPKSDTKFKYQYSYYGLKECK